MAPGQDEIETRIESLAREVAELRGCVRALEARLQSTDTPAGIVARTDAGAAPAPAEGWAPAEIVGFVGRTLVILGGAFLLRAVSRAAWLPAESGPALGLVYAAWWLFEASRTGGVPDRTSAFFFGLSGVAIAYPLLFETTARFHLLPGLIVAPSLVAFLVLGVGVARRRDLRTLAWLAVGGAVVTCLALLGATHEFVLYTAALLACAVAVESFESHERWPELRWAIAGAIDLTLLLLAMLVSQPRLSADLIAALPPSGVIIVALFAPAIYLASVATATLASRRPISVFELIQVTASLATGIGTAMVTIAFHGGSSRGIALAVVAIGAACYAVSFLSIDAEEHPRRNFYAYSTFAGVLVGAGTTMALPVSALAPVWLTLAAGGVVAGVLRDRNTLRLHGALYLVAAALPSGLLATAARGLSGPAGTAAAVLSLQAAVVLSESVAAYVILMRHRDAASDHWSGYVPGFLVAAVGVWGIAGVVAPALAGTLLHFAGGLDPMSTLATIRTAVASAFAVALAWAGRRWDRHDLVWLVYPVLVLGGARMGWEDMRYGGPENLFLSLGCYGGALIATSKLLRHAATAPPAATPVHLIKEGH